MIKRLAMRFVAIMLACFILLSLGQAALCQEADLEIAEDGYARQGLLAQGVADYGDTAIIDHKGFTVRGAVSFAQAGRIFIEMSTQEQFEKGGTGSHQVILEVLEKENVAKFVFFNVQPQKYCIRAFVDVNANGELDMGRFGPKEPWGNYRPARPRFRAPRFEEMAFEVDADIDGIHIRLE